MKIKTIQTQLKQIPLKTPFITALRRVETIEFVRVSVTCENASVGIGEAPATFAITGEDIPNILHSIESIKTQLLECELDSALEKLHASTIGSSAKAAVDMALISLLAQAKGETLFEYFHIEDTTPIHTDITISFNSHVTMLKDAIQAVNMGMNILKIKLAKDIEHAIEVSKMLAENFPHVTLLIDANQAWSLEDSLLYVAVLKGYNIELIEQPVLAKDIKSLKRITEASSIPILADEATFTLEDVKRVVESKSADMINIKLMKCGGVTKAVEILEYARAKGVTCMLGSMLEGPYSINIALYLAFAYRDVIKYVDLDSPLLYKEPSKELDFSFVGSEISFLADSKAKNTLQSHS